MIKAPFLSNGAFINRIKMNKKNVIIILIFIVHY